MKRNYALLRRGGRVKRFIGKAGFVIAALLPSVIGFSQAPVVTVTPPGLCTTGNLTATSTIQPLSIAWTGPSSGTVNTTWVSSGTKVAGNSQGSGLNQLNNPNGLFVDGSGNLYVADFTNNRVIKFTPPFNPSNNGTVVAGTGISGAGNTQLNGPTAVYVDGSGNVFVCDQGNNRIMEWSSPYTSGTCVAGGNGFGSGNTALAAPFGLYVDGSGNLFVGDKSNNRVQRFTAAQVASATAGQTSASVAGTTVLGGNGSGSSSTQLNNPSGVFVDGSGNLYTADYNNNRIQKITAAQIAGATAGQTSSSATATTPAGGNGSGIGANQLNHPNGVFLDCANNIYVADYSNNRVQQWLSGASSGTTVAGSSVGTSGSTNSLLNLPSAVVVDGTGNMFVTDYNNNRVMQYTPTTVMTFAYTLPGTYTATVTTFACATGANSALTTTNPAITGQPASTTVCAGASASMSVTASATGITYQWFENGISLGAGGGAYSGTQSATLTINPTTALMNGNTYTVQVGGTCNPGGISSSPAATLTVNTSAAIIGNPPTSNTPCVGNNTSFTVAATGTSLTYQWEVNPPSGFASVVNGVNYSGAQTATLSILNTPIGFSGNQYRVTINSTACPGAVTSTLSTLTVNPLPVITGQPLGVTVCAGGNATYVVSATGTGLNYQWQDSVAGSGVWVIQPNITPFTGANTPTLNLVGVTTSMNGNGYRCVVTSGAGCISTSSGALLTVNPVPTITPGSISSICAGVTSASLPYTGATGAPTTYTINNWSGGTFANVTNPMIPSPITIAVPGSTTAGTYTANFVVTNSGGCSSTNNVISLTVNANPTITMGASPSVCSGVSSSSVPYTSVTGSPTSYAVTWSGLALGQGFTNFSGGSLPASPISFAVPVGATPGTYTASISITDANGCSNGGTPFSITINANPTITLGANPSVCAGITTALLPYTATTASPTTYTIAWSLAATSAGFSNVTNAALPLSPINISVPGLATAGTYNGTLSVANANGCVSTTSAMSVTINAIPTITLGANPAICYGVSTANLPYTATTSSPTTYSIAWGGCGIGRWFYKY